MSWITCRCVVRQGRYCRPTTVVPASAASERVFSLVGDFVTRIRSRMDDDKANPLVFQNDKFSESLQKVWCHQTQNHQKTWKGLFINGATFWKDYHNPLPHVIASLWADPCHVVA